MKKGRPPAAVGVVTARSQERKKKMETPPGHGRACLFAKGYMAVFATPRQLGGGQPIHLDFGEFNLLLCFSIFLRALLVTSKKKKNQQAGGSGSSRPSIN